MATFNLTTNLTSGASPERVILYKMSAPNAAVDSKQFSSPHVGGHLWTFFGLIPSENYKYRWVQVDSGGNELQQYATQTFTVPASGSTRSKATQYLIADTTPGVFSGLSEFTMNGASGTDDWRGWGIKLELKGAGTEFPGINYNYNITTGKVSMLDDTGAAYILSPGEKLVADFESQTIPSAVVVQGAFTGIRYINVNETIAVDDFGKNLLQCNGEAEYFEISLPPIASVAENRPLIIKTGRGNHKCMGVISQDANAIDWLYGAMNRFYMGVQESIKIYHQRNGGVSTWQVLDPCGNYHSVGTIVSEFSPLAMTFNKVSADDTSLNINSHARLYDYIQRLTTSERVAYTAYSANQQKYTLDSGGGLFHVPNLNNLFARTAASGEAPGIWRDHQTLTHSHEQTIGTLPVSVWGRGLVARLLGKYNGSPTMSNADLTSPPTAPGGGFQPNFGSETYPKHYTERKYILC